MNMIVYVGFMCGHEMEPFIARFKDLADRDAWIARALTDLPFIRTLQVLPVYC